MRHLRSCLLSAFAVGAAQAQTLSRVVVQTRSTLDPYAQNESLTNVVNGQIYEFLVARDKQLNIVPQLATEWKQNGLLHGRSRQLKVKFHDVRVHGRRCGVLAATRRCAHVANRRLRQRLQGEARKIDDPTVEFNLPQFNPVRC